MGVGRNGVIMEAVVVLVGVEVSLGQEVVQTLHQRTAERNVQGRLLNQEPVIHKDALLMDVGRIGEVTEVAVELVEVEDKLGQEAAFNQRIMERNARGRLLKQERVITNHVVCSL